MKRLFLILSICTAITTVAVAQPRAIGLRLGGNQELSFQQSIHYGYRFIQFDVGTYYANKAIQITWTHNWVSQSINSSAFSVYGGGGIGIGFSINNKDNDWYPRFWDKNATDYAYRWENRKALRRFFLMGIAAQLGIEYRFENIPLSLSIDYRPLFGFEFGKLYYPNGNNPQAGKDGETEYISKRMGIQYHTPGLWAFGLGLKYCF